MREPKIGDTVVITNGGSRYYNLGDTAILLVDDEYGTFLADFTTNDEYYGPGAWYIDTQHFTVTEEAQ